VESDKVNLVTSGTKLEGTVEFTDFTRFEGYMRGTLRGGRGSHLVLGENGVVEGLLEGDEIVIDGFVRGNIVATGRVVISGTGRVIGDIRAPSVGIRFGAFFEGKCDSS